MSNGPRLDDRGREELLAAFRERSESYTPSWDATSADSGTALLSVGARFGAALRQRLDRVPEKQRLAMLDELGFGPQPPRAARLPLTVAVSSGVDRNVSIPGGTQAVAETDGDDESFEIPDGSGFEAIPASLTSVYAVDPARDRFFDHTDQALEGTSTTLFSGPSQQEHVCYLGAKDLLAVEGGAIVTLTVETAAPASAFERWEFYGEDEAGAEGWHELSPVEGASADTCERVRWRFRLPGPTVETAVDGTASRWLRCRSDPDPIRIDSATVEVDREGGAAPAEVFANDVPLSVDGPWRPFGRVPQPPSTLYLGSGEALGTPGAVAELTFEPADERRVADGKPNAEVSDEGGNGIFGGPPDLSWEYWDGQGWARLEPLHDGTDQLRTPGSIRLCVPDDIEPTSISGQKNHWVRARLVDGSYGNPISTDVAGPEPPQFGGLGVTYDRVRGPVTERRTCDNGSFGRPESASFDAFEPLPDDEPALYLGFDAPLRGGPLAVLFDLDEHPSLRSLDTGVRWEARLEGEWLPVDTTDGTAGLTERGIVEITLPTATTACERFGERRHWLRARVSGQALTSHSDDRLPEDDGRRPVLTGIYPNTQWADNVRTVTDETVGGSDGDADQVFECANAPVTDADLWVEESAALASDERQALVEARPDDVEVRDDDPETETWIRWTEQTTLLDSAGADRHYVLDRTDGTIQFGDGEHGAVPPSGQGNVRVTYRTGGGNVNGADVGAVSHLRSSIALVESVTNHAPARGGVSLEAAESMADRAAARLRSRGRAVSPSDFEAIARAAVRELAAVTCRRGNGEVELVIVPETEAATPTPSAALCSRVQSAATARSPATLGTSDIRVRGPTYATVSVAVTVKADCSRSVTAVESRVEGALASTLHPLGDETDETGWDFGCLPEQRRLRERVATVEAVDGVQHIAVDVELKGKQWSLGDFQTENMAGDTLVCSGDHAVTVTGGTADGR